MNEFSNTLVIETNTPVESISASTAGPLGYPYAIKTLRGVTYVRNVIHATNGFAGHLISGLQSKIVGARAHMSAQRPGQSLPRSNGIRSWGIIYGGSFDYVTQRPSKPTGAFGDILIGGGFMRSLKQGVDQIGLWDDNKPLDALTITHIMGVLPAMFYPKWGTGSEIKQLWTGILGITGDLLPLVGRLDEKLTGRNVRHHPESETTQVKGKTGEWVAAGFSGDGMIWSWLCGVYLGLVIAESEEEEIPQVPGMPGGKPTEWFPQELLISSERLQSANVSN